MSVPADTQVDRRSFFYRVIGGVAGVVGGLLAIPVVGLTLSPLFERRIRRKPSRVGEISRFPVDEPTLAAFDLGGPGEAAFQQGVYVVNRGDAKFDIFKLNCTHLGCPFQWKQAARGYFCPCHGGVFDDKGDVTGGPPFRALDRYEATVRDGILYAGALQLGQKRAIS